MTIDGLDLLGVVAVFAGAIVVEHLWLKRIDRIEQRRAENLAMWEKIEQAEYRDWLLRADKRPLYERLAPYGWQLQPLDEAELDEWRAAA